MSPTPLSRRVILIRGTAPTRMPAEEHKPAPAQSPARRLVLIRAGEGICRQPGRSW
jgi:hypothetical protein